MNIKKHFINNGSFLIALLILFTGFIVGNAFTTPSQPPPEGNVEAPINIGPVPQTKTGDLTLGNNLIVQGLADIARWAHTNVVRNLNADQVDSYSAADLLAQSAASPVPIWVIENNWQEGRFSGAIGGRKNANKRCRDAFGENAMMFGSQHINCYNNGTCALDFRVDSPGWFDYTANEMSKWHDAFFNCSGWRTHVNQQGFTVDRYGNFETYPCNSSLTIVCAYLK